MAHAWRRHGQFLGTSLKRRRPTAGEIGSQEPTAPEPVEQIFGRVIEEGSFARGVCLCTWEGPGRRARSGAQTDVEMHTIVCPLQRPADDGNIEEPAGVDLSVHRAAVAPGPN